MEFDTLSNYTNIAKKTISKFASKFYPGLAKEMLNSDETVSEVANAIMYADWNWDKNRKGKKTGLSKTIYSYRNQCAIWAIKTYITSKYKKNQKIQKCNDYFQQNLQIRYDQDPADVYENKEYLENLQQDVKDLLETSPLTDKQKQQIKMYYYDEKTLSEIGDIFGVTREAVRQNIHKGLEILRSTLEIK